MRSAATILWASAVYGFAIGSIHSARLAAWNLAKFPLLIFVTALVCGPAYFAFTLFVTRGLTRSAGAGPAGNTNGLRLRDVMAMSLRTFAGAALLLASLAPVACFVASTADPPHDGSLGEYPFFLGLNVVFIAVCGALSLGRETLRLAAEHAIPRRRAAVVLGLWLGVSLFVGGQCAWFLRPFFGPPTIADPPIIEGTRPDWRGATSFYEAVWHIVSPPAR